MQEETIPKIEDYINQSAEYLIKNINKKDYGWGLNIEKGGQTSSIVNTAEAIFVIMHSNKLFHYIKETQEFLLKALENHPKKMGYRTRYFSFGLLGLYELGVREPSIINRYITQLENLVIEDDFGWPEDVNEEHVSIFETLIATIAITQYKGLEYLNNKFPHWKQKMENLKNQEGNWGFYGTDNTSIAAISYANLIYSILDPKSTLVDIRELLYQKIKELIINNELLEIQLIPGTDWHHYTYVWGIKSLLYSKPLIDTQIEELIIIALRKISDLFTGNRGFIEPYKSICNVRSIFNNVLALCAIKDYFDLSHYLYLSKNKYKLNPKKVFIIHGHDNKSKLELYRFLERIGLQPIILHEQPDEGRTIIEKLEKYSNIGYCFALLTPDDIGYKKNTPKKKQSRARQNVVFEMGLFIGKLGRDRVCCLHKGELELPSDLDGILYLKYNKSIEEKGLNIIEELGASGFKVDFK